MIAMNKEDKEWLQKCLDDPKRYKIYVDNDDIFVVEVTEEDPDGMDSAVNYSFSNFGYDFALSLLEHLGANVEYV